MTEHQLAAIQRIFPKLSAYGRAIEAGNNGAEELDALKAEMYQNPDDLRDAIEQAKQIQGFVISSPFGIISYDYPDRAPQRLARLQWLEQTLGVTQLDAQNIQKDELALSNMS